VALARGHSRAGHGGVLRARKLTAVQDVGPRAGRDSVVIGAGHREVSDPGGGIPFTSPGDLQTKINDNPPESVFVAANSITWTSEVQAGANNITSKAPKIWIPTGRVIDGNNGTNQGIVLGFGAELHGGEWINFGNAAAPEFVGAIRTNGDAGTLVTDVHAHHCYQSPVAIRSETINGGIGCVFSHSTVHSNGRYGFNGTQTSLDGPDSEDCVYEYLNIYNNNTHNNNPGGNAGGNKISGQKRPIIRQNWSHDNIGAGLWTDYANGLVVFEDNVLENNLWWGIFYEVGTGQVSDGNPAVAQIRYNYAKNNALGNGTFPANNWFNAVQILASCTDGQINGGTGYDLHHNLIDGTARAIGFVAHDNHPTDVKGCRVHDNDVWLRGSAAGVVGGSWEDSSDPRVGISPWLLSSGNGFTANHYHVPVGGLGASRWRWGGTHGATLNRTWAQWQSDGNDLGGTLEEIAA
jgi:hypothetical protein